MFGFMKADNKPLRLVVGLNQVDKIIPNGWNDRLNLPKDGGDIEIKRKMDDLVKRLSKYTTLPNDNVEFYSALKRYRLLPLMNKVVKHSFAGFKMDNMQPRDPFELADPEVKIFVEKERNKIQSGNDGRGDAKKRLFDELSKILSKDDMNTLLSKLNKENSIPPKIAIFGKSGVGKTTTVNNLFNASFKTSHVLEGTLEAQEKLFTLPTGGQLNIIDLPGYGRSISKDKEYEKIYKQFIPQCDLVFLIVQASSRDISDDEEMILKTIEWLKDNPSPIR